jgi:hypothetical protein
MCNKEDVVGYLYGELSPAESSAFRSHLARCAECRGELEGLEATRQHLATWSPPDPELDFTVVQKPRSEAAVRRRWAVPVPQWALAAAAALLVVAGAAAIANVEVRYGQDGSLTVRTGWAGAPAEPPVPAPAAAAAASPGVTPVRFTAASAESLQSEIAALGQRLQEIENSLRSGDRFTRNAGVSASDLRKVLASSEDRQRTEMQVLIGQVWRDFNAARASDLARVQQTLMQAQGLTNTQLRQQRETLDSLRYLHTVSHQK